jgi:acyl-CoA dehydrogenase
MAENVIHLVLARLPDAPEGTRGISLFLVPKRMVNADGSLGTYNDVHCVSIEHKMGIHASPTCVMSFGDKDGAIGYLVGRQNHGLAHMFTMMNEARQKVGLQGLGIAERAYQAARDYAKDRVQGRPAGQKTGDRVPIVQHPDVRRMLLTMRAQTEAMRAFAYSLAADIDRANRHPDKVERAERQARVDLLIPVLKAWCTEVGVEVTSIGVQVHGGMGFVEETGACQFLRDARITPIYEGTTGIQAADLVSRKIGMDNGRAMAALIDEMNAIDHGLGHAQEADVKAIRDPLRASIASLKAATDWMLHATTNAPNEALAASVNYLMLTGYVVGAWYMAKAALAAAPRLSGAEKNGFYRAKVATARFYAEQILPKATALLTTIQSGGSGAMAFEEEQF